MPESKDSATAGVKVLYSRILAQRPMVKINGNVQYLSSGKSMIEAGGKVVSLFENTWMRACGVGSLQKDGSRKINKMGNTDLIRDVDSERSVFDLAVIATIRTAIPEFDTQSLISFYKELMEITGENDSMVRRGVSSSLGKIAAEDLLLSGALSQDSPFFTRTTVGKAIRQKGIETYGIIEVREQLDLMTSKPVVVKYPGESDPDFNKLNDTHLPNNDLSNVLPSQALPGLSGHSVLSNLGDEKAFVVGGQPSVAHLLAQQGLMKSAPVDTKQLQLGQAILGLVTVINSKRVASWEPQGHLSYTATVVSALSKGADAFTNLCQKPEENSIPKYLVTCVRDYIHDHPELKQLADQKDFARRIKLQLIKGEEVKLHEEFGPAPASKGICTMR